MFSSPSCSPGAATIAASCIAGFMFEEELYWLAQAASRMRTIIEVGSWKGRSTKAMAMATLGIVYAVDSWGPKALEMEGQPVDIPDSPDKVMHEFMVNMRDEILPGKVVPIRLESGDAPAILETLFAGRGRRADMVFIDGSHDEASATRDILNYRKLLEPGGLLCGHDYSPTFPGVISAVDRNVPGFRVSPESKSIWYATV